MTNPYKLLTPVQRYVYDLLLGIPDGVCRRTFALNDVYEVANRIAEIEARLGITINRERCTSHDHRHRVVRYSL